MKTSTKQKLIKALAAAFVLTAAGGTVFAINSISNDKVETPFNGTYNGTLTAFAEETSPSEVTGSAEVIESATQVGNLVLKKMISVGNDYMLLATSISNVAEYKAIGYYITENGVTTKKEGNTYYTGIQVNTNTEEGTHTYSMQEIYGEYSYENAGMIVCEIPYTADAEYAVKPYLVKNDDKVVYGANGYKEGTNPYVLKNGSFEKGDLDGWTLSEKKLGDVSDAIGYWGEPLYNKDGNYLFSAYTVKTQDKPEYDQGGDEGATGTLTSSTFTLGGSGWITFKLGGAKNYDKVYLEVIKVKNEQETVVARYYNSEWTDAGSAGCKLNAYRADLSNYIGSTLKIRVTDNASTDYGLFFLDSVQTYHEAEPKDGVIATNIIDYVVYNGGFEKDTDGWTVETTEGPVNEVFGAIGNADAKWGENRSYNNDGKFFRNMNEACKGYLMSSAFIVSENGWMTFKLGGSKAHSYVSIIDAKTGAELARFVNEKYVGAWPNNGWEMYSYKVNLIESGIAAGTEVRIKVVDGATKDYGVVIVDSFVTCYDQEPEGTRIQNCKPDYSLVNGSFETGNLDGWTMNGDLGLVTNTEVNAPWYTKNDDATKNGTAYLFTFVDVNGVNHEGGTGSLKSNNFMLKKDGTVAFKFGGAGGNATDGLNRDVYVQICKADGTVLAKFYNDKEGRKNTELVDYYYTFSLEEDCECYFEVVDNSTGNYGCFVLDGVEINCSVPANYTLATNQLG